MSFIQHNSHLDPALTLVPASTLADTQRIMNALAALASMGAQQPPLVHQMPPQPGPQIPEAVASGPEVVKRGPGRPPKDKTKTEAENVEKNLKRRLSEVVDTRTGMKADRNMRPRTKRWSLQQIPQKLLSGNDLPVK